MGEVIPLDHPRREGQVNIKIIFLLYTLFLHNFNFMNCFGLLFRKIAGAFAFVVSCIFANRKLASTNKPVAFRSVHTGIEPPFFLKINYAITACMTLGFTSRKY